MEQAEQTEIRILDRAGRIEWAVLIDGEAVVRGNAPSWPVAFRRANETRQAEVARRADG